MAGQANAVDVAIDGIQRLEEFVFVIERTRTQSSEPTAAVAMDRCAQRADIVDDPASCSLTRTAVVLETIGAALDE
jgi:hypothetical protein